MSDTMPAPIADSPTLKHHNPQPVNIEETSSSPVFAEAKDGIPEGLPDAEIATKVGQDVQSHDVSENKREFDDLEEENASVLVIILQCETKSCDNNIANLKWVFSNPYFTVQVCAVDPPLNIPTHKTLTNAQYIENYYMRKALTYASEGPYLIDHNGNVDPQFWWKDIPCIIVKDSSVSNITPLGRVLEPQSPDFSSSSPEDNIIGGMKRRIQVALDRAREADLFFLCKWNDACNKYVDVSNVRTLNHGSSLKWSVQPTSTQAIMYTPSSRDYVRESLVSTSTTLSDFLNSNISQGRLLATVFVPNIIDFDIELATSNEDYAKLAECAPVATSTPQSTSVSTFIWLGVIIALVVLVAWALIQLSPQHSSQPLPS